jgi:acyl-homoserine-lactone acylase
MNSNDAPWFTNMLERLDAAKYPRYYENGELRMRSQVILSLLHNNRKFSLEEAQQLKFTNTVLMAERIKPELIAAVRGSAASRPELLQAADVLERWDNQVGASSRGAVLFTTFADRYMARTRKPYAKPWDATQPVSTPSGLGDPETALAALAEAAAQVRRLYGSADVAWGDVHRFRFKDKDLPADGASGTYGVYRVMGFTPAEGGKRVAGMPIAAGGPLRGFGDGWILTVEFTVPVRAYSVVAYGQTTDPNSKHCCDQIEMFAAHQLRKVWFRESEIREHLEREYRP